MPTQEVRQCAVLSVPCHILQLLLEFATIEKKRNKLLVCIFSLSTTLFPISALICRGLLHENKNDMKKIALLLSQDEMHICDRHLVLSQWHHDGDFNIVLKRVLGSNCVLHIVGIYS